jgi:hypothetical protein
VPDCTSRQGKHCGRNDASARIYAEALGVVELCVISAAHASIGAPKHPLSAQSRRMPVAVRFSGCELDHRAFKDVYTLGVLRLTDFNPSRIIRAAIELFISLWKT